MNIGFVGLGRMGANMARRLQERGYHVTTLFDTNRNVATDLAQELSATACPTLGDVTAGADVIFTVVSDEPHLHRRR
jgi:3-hydroxyisobutyrate dehydrogenase